MEISPAQPWLWDVSQGSSDLCLADKRKITFPKKTPQQVHLVLFEVPPPAWLLLQALLAHRSASDYQSQAGCSTSLSPLLCDPGLASG